MDHTVDVIMALLMRASYRRALPKACSDSCIINQYSGGVVLKLTTILTFIFLLLSHTFAFANPDAVVIRNGDLRIRTAGTGLVFPDGSVLYKAPTPMVISTLSLGIGDNGCLNGGIRLLTGVDTNGNGILDLSEVKNYHDICHGATGATGGGGNGFPWVSASGTTQAVSNTGYIANGASQVTIRLPASPALGDVVRISGAGSGGWKIEANEGHSIVGRKSPTITHFPLDLLSTIPGNPVKSIASSSDGTKLVAVAKAVIVDNGAAMTGGLIYTSSNSGSTWTARATPEDWCSVSSSSDGSHLIAAASRIGDGTNGLIAASLDAGVTWGTSASGSKWDSVALSSDGTKILASGVDISGTSGVRSYSIDSGQTWNHSLTYPGKFSFSVAMSSDGTKGIYLSAPSLYLTKFDGSTLRIGPLQSWYSAALSLDGSNIIASHKIDANLSQLMHSSDSGATWTPGIVIPAPYVQVVSSNDGKTFFAAGVNDGTTGHIYRSEDSGKTWIPSSISKAWSSLTATSDGNRVIATTSDNEVYTFTFSAGLRAWGARGGQYDSIELQYLGNDVFNILSTTGELIANY